MTYIPNCIKYWLRILHMDEYRYPKQCYLMLRQLDNAGRKTWATSIKELLFMYGFGNVWLAQGVGDDGSFLNVFKQRIKDCYLQKWQTDVNALSKSFHYKHFKTSLDIETYLKIDLSYTQRIIFSNFRCSGHSLMIEKGRHMGLDRAFSIIKECPEHLKFEKNILCV